MSFRFGLRGPNSKNSDAMKGGDTRGVKMVDMHSHILPGIDDGSPSLETSIALVKELVRGGVTDIVATPHFVDETIYTSPRAKNRGLIVSLKNALRAEGVEVNLHLGNEIYMFPGILEYVRRGIVSPAGESKYLLIELPMSGEFPGYADIFLELIRAGYEVILAHPERYVSFQEDFSLIEELTDTGVLLQCNIGSFVGQYGKKAKKVAMRLAKEKRIFALGSDIHHLRGEEFMENALKAIRKCYPDTEEFRAVVEGNARGVIGG